MKQKFYLLIAGLLMLTLQLKAQAPNSFNYQAVARDASGGVLPNTAIGLRFTIRKTTAVGTIVYQEQQSATTNEFGLFSVPIGSGIVVSGSMSAISWGTDNYYLQVEMDPTGGTVYINMGATQLLSVPYALYAGNGGSKPKTYTGGTGIGIVDTVISANTSDALWNANELQGNNISNTVPTSGQILQWNGTAWAPTTPVIPATGWNLTGNSGTTAGTDFIGTTDTKDLVFKTDGKENMRISNSNGFVGIGTNAPPQALTVSDGNNTPSDFGGYNFQIQLEAPNSTTTGIYLDGSTNNNGLAGIVERARTTAFYSGLNNNADYRIAGVAGIDADDLTNAKDGSAGITVNNSSGFVGVGQAYPQSALDVYYQGGDGTGNAGITFENGSSGNGSYRLWVSDFNNGEGDGKFILYDNNQGQDRFTIDEDGNMGLGTTSPAQGLDVENGNLQFGSALMPAGDPGGLGEVLQSNGPGSAPTWVVSSGGGGAWALNGNNGTVYPANYLGTKDDNGLQFEVNGNEAGLIEDQDGGAGGNGNTALGYQSLFNNYVNGGSENVGVGFGALFSNETAINNTAVGYDALFNNNSDGFSQAWYNTAVGNNAMLNNVDGQWNTAIGDIALMNNTSGLKNSALGTSLESNTTGSFNVAAGQDALANNVDGSYNTALGVQAGDQSDANDNTSVGYNTLQTNNSGSDITVLGYQADVSSDGLSNATAIGASAVVSASNTVQLGSGCSVQFDQALMPGGDPGTAGYVLQSNGAGTAPTWVASSGGGGGGWSLTGNAISTNSGDNFLGTTNSNPIEFVVSSAYTGAFDPTDANVFIGGAVNGAYAGNFQNGVTANYTAGYNNVGIGAGALGALAPASTTAGQNYDEVAIGYGSLLAFNPNNSEYLSSTAVGSLTLRYASTGTPNDAFGFEALYNNQTGSYNVAIGYQTLLNNDNDGFGEGQFNTALGSSALQGNVDGSSNTALGYNANVGSDPLTNATAIGANAIVNASNAIQEGSTSVTLWNFSNNNGVIDLNNDNYYFGTTASGNGYGPAGNNDAGAGNIAMGLGALGSANSSTSNNIALGDFALSPMSGGEFNTIIGFYAGRYIGSNGTTSNVSGSTNLYTTLSFGNTSVGRGSAYSISSGSLNTAVGLFAMGGNFVGNGSVTGNANTAVGFEALDVASGSGIVSNTAVGSTALLNNTGNKNVAVGDSALASNTTGESNTTIGYDADVSSGTLTNATAIGANAVVGESNAVVLGSTGVSVGINTSTPNSSLQITGGTLSLPITVSATGVDLSTSPNAYTVIITATGQTVTLPTASTCTGRVYVISAQFASGSLTTSSFNNSFGVGSTSIAAGSIVTIQSDGTNWDQIR